MSQNDSLGQKPVGRRPVHATTASIRAESVSPSEIDTLAVLPAVAITTHPEASSPDTANSVAQSDPFALIGIAFTRCAFLRADAGATSTLADTAKIGSAHGM